MLSQIQPNETCEVMGYLIFEPALWDFWQRQARH
jgi:hypothetical protein